MPQHMIPPKDADFLEWAKNLVAYVTAHADDWGISEEQVAALNSLLTEFQRDYAALQEPNHGSTDVYRKNEARKALEAGARDFVNEYLRFNSAVSDEDRLNMGIPPRSASHTPQPPPATHPGCRADTSELRQVGLVFWDNGSSKRGKPENAHGAEIGWGVLDEPPVSVSGMTHSAFATKSPHVLLFDESERGKRVYYCLRWENMKGEKGPWGEIGSAIIP